MRTLYFPVAFHEARRKFDTVYFTELWRRTGGNVTHMARLAGIGRAHVRRYLKELSIEGGHGPGASTRSPTGSVRHIGATEGLVAETG